MKKSLDSENEKGKAWLKTELKPYRSRIGILAAVSVLSALFSLAFSYLVRYLVNSAADGQKKSLIFFAGVILGILLFNIFSHTLGGYLAEKYRAQIRTGLQRKLFLKLLKSDLTSTQNYHSGDLLTRLTTDVSEVERDTVSILPSVFGLIVQGVGAVIALLSLDVLFTVIFLVVALFVGGMSVMIRKKFKLYHKETMELDGKNRAFMQESLTSLLTVKAYGAEEKSSQKSDRLLEAYYRKRMERNRFHALVNSGFSLFGNVGMIFAVIWFGVQLLHGSADYGIMLSAILLLGQIRSPITSFSSIMPTVYARRASAERLALIQSLPSDNGVDGEAFPYEELEKIRLENLSFGYDERPIFDGACAEIEAGKITCIKGGSGIGKSTLFKLILSVLKPDSGGLALEGGGRKEGLTAKDRPLFAYVPQGNFLFSGSIYENLTFFAEQSDDKKIAAALKTACAEFVFDLPEGLGATLGERGVGLSEGQLQRLAIARAILSERPILLLDEATSALDEDTERRLLENISALQGVTCLIVTHRPAALGCADKILYVDSGKIYEEKGICRDK